MINYKPNTSYINWRFLTINEPKMSNPVTVDSNNKTVFFLTCTNIASRNKRTYDYDLNIIINDEATLK